MQTLRTGIRSLRSASSSVTGNGGLFADRVSILGFIAGARTFSQSAACSSTTFLDKEEVTTRVVDLLKSIPFVDPSKRIFAEVHKILVLVEGTEVTIFDVSGGQNFGFVRVSPVASFKDMQLNTLDNVEVMTAVEEEFAVDIPDGEASKFSTTANVIDYIATHPQAK